MNSIKIVTLLSTILIWMALVPAQADYSSTAPTLSADTLADKYFPSTGRYCMKVSRTKKRSYDGQTATEEMRQIRRGEHQTLFAKPLGDDLNGLLIYQIIPLSSKVQRALSGLKHGEEFCVMGTYLNRQWPAAILAFDL
jgi:hypothetical protein